MKKVVTCLTLILVLCLSVLALQNDSSTSPAKKKSPAKPAVDCSAVNDTTLAANVKDRLTNTPSLKDYAINVAAKDGAITLTGNVKAGRNKGTATSQAKRVACVKKVDNQITVEASTAKSTKSGK